ncbi:MAG TPA: hypothetical protein VG166_14410 [Caulobacteraceae bacterium]|jgi:hypothetical protein|nr:hypothetical protein [Caulobacteraceae bacterium]
MPTKTLTGGYPGGYYLSPTFTKLDIEGSASIGGSGVTTTAAHPSTVTNLGTVAGTLDGIVLSDGGRITNGSSTDGAALISGSASDTYGGSAIVVKGAAGTVINRATIMNVAGPTAYYYGFSVDLQAGGTVTNGSAVDTTALIAGGYGVEIGGVGTVNNFGTISSQSTHHGASVSLSTGVVNNGVPSDKVATLTDGVNMGVGTITNFGTIGFGILQSGGTITNGTTKDPQATIAGRALFFGAGTITNFGTIANPGGTAVLFKSSSDRLVEEGSGVLIGRVVGDGGALELAAAAGTGTISGVGSSVNGFGQIVVDAGAGWDFSGPNMVRAGVTLTNESAIVDQGAFTNKGNLVLGALFQLATGASLTNASTGHIDITGDTGISAASGATGTKLVNAGTIDKTGGTGTSSITAAVSNTGAVFASSGVLNVRGAVGGTGTWDIDGGTLVFRDAVAAGGVVSFLSNGGQLELTDTAQFAAKVSGFAAGDTLDLRSISFGSATMLSYSGTSTAGTLTVSNGSHVAKIALLGQYAAANFAMSSDGQGGTDIGFVAHPSPALASLAGPGR